MDADADTSHGKQNGDELRRCSRNTLNLRPLGFGRPLVCIWLGKWEKLLLFQAGWLWRLRPGRSWFEGSWRRARLVHGPDTSLAVAFLLPWPWRPARRSCLSFCGSTGAKCFLRTGSIDLELAFNASRAYLIGLSFLRSPSTVNEFPGPTEMEQNCIFLIELSDY